MLPSKITHCCCSIQGTAGKKVSTQTATTSVDVLAQTHPIHQRKAPQRKHSMSIMSVGWLASICKLPWRQKRAYHYEPTSSHDQRECQTSVAQPHELSPHPSNQYPPNSRGRINRHQYFTDQAHRHLEQRDSQQRSWRMLRSNSFSSIVSSTDDSTKWILYGYV